MKIEWLNSDLTEARVTRGWWRWKRVAHVKYTPITIWRFASGDDVGDLWVPLQGARTEEMERREQQALRDRNWQPVSSPPVAKVVRR